MSKKCPTTFQKIQKVSKKISKTVSQNLWFFANILHVPTIMCFQIYILHKWIGILLNGLKNYWAQIQFANPSHTMLIWVNSVLPLSHMFFFTYILHKWIWILLNLTQILLSSDKMWSTFIVVNITLYIIHWLYCY